jgi:hypothetical protein
MKTAFKITKILAALFIMLAFTASPLGWRLEQGRIAQAETDNNGESYLAIVDLYVTNQGSSNPNLLEPNGYTALNWNLAYTSPYIKNSVGTFVPGADINSGIGGDFTYIWVKYDWVAPTADTPVLVDIAVHHWPNWVVSCPAGWTAAQGDIGGALTTRAKNACWRNGLCVHFVPMNQTDHFITTLGLYFGISSEPNVAPLAPANGGYWPLTQDDLDIHMGCGDDHWMYVLYDRARKWPAMPVALASPPDAGKVTLLKTFAPRVWLANYEPDHPEGEIYYPSPVEWSFDYLNRIYKIITSGASWWLITKQPLSSPSDVLPYFHGCDGISTASPCTLGDTPAYAFWDEVNVDVNGAQVKVVDLIYFFYYPYNRGKQVLGTIYGNHVGDWEHLSLRLIPQWDEQAGWSFRPAQAYLSAHDFGRGYLWDQIPRMMGDVVFLPMIFREGSLASGAPAPKVSPASTDGAIDPDSHPVIYAAWGAHGVWLDEGAHVYKHLVFGDLTDYAGPGTAWDTWRRIEAFNYDTQAGLNGDLWPVWMGTDFNNPTNGGVNPASGPVFRWGNLESGCDISGQCRLENGPTGPVSKNVWDSQMLR